jgi:hypothetical protein
MDTDPHTCTAGLPYPAGNHHLLAALAISVWCLLTEPALRTEQSSVHWPSGQAVADRPVGLFPGPQWVSPSSSGLLSSEQWPHWRHSAVTPDLCPKRQPDPSAGARGSPVIPPADHTPGRVHPPTASGPRGFLSLPCVAWSPSRRRRMIAGRDGGRVKAGGPCRVAPPI